jgi:hypothetical protein
MRKILRSTVAVRPPRVVAPAVRPPRVATPVNPKMFQAGRNAGELASAVVNTIRNVSKAQARRGMVRGR